MVSFLVSSPHNNLLRKVCKKDWLFGVILLILNAAFCIKTFVFLGTEEILESKEIVALFIFVIDEFIFDTDEFKDDVEFKTWINLLSTHKIAFIVKLVILKSLLKTLHG